MSSIFSIKKNPFFEYDMNELNEFLKKIKPEIDEKDKFNLEKILTVIVHIDRIEKTDGPRRRRITEINESATSSKRKTLLDEREKILSEMKANQTEIKRRKDILDTQKKKFYKDNKQIIDEHLKKGKIEVSTKVKAIIKQRETRQAISKSKAAANQEGLERLGPKASASASASARTLAATTKNHQATIRRNSTNKKLFSAFQKAAETKHYTSNLLGKSRKKKRGKGKKNKRKGSKKARR
jgi:hypothetical protein